MLRVATLNTRYVLDRSSERLPLLRKELAGIGADILLLQEINACHMPCRILPAGATEWSVPAVPCYLALLFGRLCAWLMTTPPFRLWMWATAVFQFYFLERILGGHAVYVFHHPVLSKLVFLVLGSWLTFSQCIASLTPRGAFTAKSAPAFRIDTRVHPKVSSDPAVLLVGGLRIAQRAVLADGTAVVNVHLDSHTDAEATPRRTAQANALVKWVEKYPRAVIGGDFNDTPDSAVVTAILAAGFVSAHATVHGSEPPVTWPTGLIGVSSAAERGVPDEPPHGCLDFLFVRGFRVEAAGVFANAAEPGDSTLYPSDHCGIHATLAPL